MRYKGGVISATAPTTSSSTASGIWTLEQQLQALAANTWPLAPVQFIGTLINGAGTTNFQAYDVALDSTKNIYAAGYYSNGGIYEGWLIKYNPFGVVQWQQRIYNSGGQDLTINSMYIDTSNNIYVAANDAAGSGTDGFLAKYNTSGTVQWQRRLGGTGTDVGRAVTVDSSGNVYMLGYINNGANTYLAKYDSAGTFQWQRAVSQGAQIWPGNQIATDSTGNIYFANFSLLGGSTYAGFFTSYNSSGTLRWSRQFAYSSYFQAGKLVVVDSSNNVYYVGEYNHPSSGLRSIYLAKFDTAGTVVWKRGMTGTGSSESGSIVASGATTDSSGNIYLNCKFGGTTNNAVFIKFDSSGTLLWQRKLTGANFGGDGLNSDGGLGAWVDNVGSVYFANFTNTSPIGAVISKLPDDGSKTGTYTVGSQTFTYAASVVLEDTPDATSSTYTMSNSTPTMTSSTATTSVATTTFTSAVTTI